MEINPSFANIVTPSESVVVSAFDVEFDGGGGEVHVVMPYSMVEPMRDVLTSSMQSEAQGGDNKWARVLANDIKMARVGLSCRIAERQIRLGDVLHMRPNDVIPIEVFGEPVLNVNHVPKFRTELGRSRGYLALKILGRVESTLCDD